MFVFWIPFFLFVFGLCVGSFMNVLVLRFGFTERGSPRSRCMACDMPIPWYDLLPGISFFVLRGRCRRCGSALSFQYPLVEFTVAVLFVLAILYVPPVLSFWPVAAFASLLVFLAALTGLVAYDIRHTLVPLPFVYALLLSAFAATLSQSFFLHNTAPLIDSALGGAALFGFFIAVVVVTKGRGMGSGDAYVAGAIGILLGFTRGIEAVMIGIWAGTIVALLLLFLSSLSKKNGLFAGMLHVTMKTEMPLIPFLALGTAVALYTDVSPLAATASLVSFLAAHI